ncbi:serine/threonine-protein kinase 11-interacting protein isoform X2 [Protopterus annectens]|uniref:serine/threonine-protein kinase 11-interacting protein isoform X2 n=1 Tax=Protopterus annectens TaxID=7888 RepID=UPI001CFAAB69|nr:serine/threonine-protein kinase 11-interacting protein isoform X2 [Protopterus annectens]
MSAHTGGEPLVQSLARLLRDCGDLVLDGTSTLTLQPFSLHHLTQLFDQHLQFRNHQHGFVALPSHPSETAVILQLQFLFDVLQKTVSLKLVHPLGPRLQSIVKIFPFKSLRYLELKRVPPHCLEGLGAVYSQLEMLICSSCFCSLEEIIAMCGGDLSSALPWLELHTLKFSYNSLTALDDSLQLLNVLKKCDLSHNKIQECAEYFMPLTELEYLNLGYNFLSKVPVLSLSSRVKLTILILRNNELDGINGVEQLSNLQQLDLAFNLLLEHAQLAPLSQLHRLKKLYLEGNPLYYHKNHRTATVKHLSPKAAFLNLILDDELLSASELAHLPKQGQRIGQAVRNSFLEASRSDQSVLETSVCGDLAESTSPTEGGPSKLPRKKSKSKIKVRRASISEPSDTDHEPNEPPASGVLLQHQMEIEKIDTFRDQLGEDWLQYKHHLEGASSIRPESHLESVTCCQRNYLESSASMATCENSPAIITEGSDNFPEREEQQDDQVTTASRGTVDYVTADEMESMEDPSAEFLSSNGAETVENGVVEDEEEDLEVDVCHPLVVGVLPEEGTIHSENSWIFLRLKPSYLMEVDLKSAKVIHKMELDTLLSLDISEVIWRDQDAEKPLPALELCFDYICKDKQKRTYVILDESPEQVLQNLVDVFSKVLEENLKKKGQEESPLLRLQCLRCKEEITVPRGKGGNNLLLTGHEEKEQSDVSKNGPATCYACSSDHMILLPHESEMKERSTTASVASLYQNAENGHSTDILRITFMDSELCNSFKCDTTLNGLPCDSTDRTIQMELQTEPFDQRGVNGGSFLDIRPQSALTAENRTFYIGGEDADEGLEHETVVKDKEQSIEGSTEERRPFKLPLFNRSQNCERSLSCPVLPNANAKQKSPGLGHSESDYRSYGSLAGSYRYGTPGDLTVSQLSTPSEYEEDFPGRSTGYDLETEDFTTVDHRIKLFLDMEVFEENTEEFCCVLKVSVVKYGRPGEYLSLLVVTNLQVYILQIVAEISPLPVFPVLPIIICFIPVRQKCVIIT